MSLKPLALLALLIVSASCRRPAGESVRAELLENCVVIKTGEGSGWAEWLSRYMGAAQRYTVDQIQQASDTCLKSDSVLIITGPGGLDDKAKQVIIQHLSRGGRLLNLGFEHVLEGPPTVNVAVFAGAYFVSTTRLFRVSHSGLEIETDPVSYKSPFQPLNGICSESSRWLPVIGAIPSTAENAGWPAFITINKQESDLYSISGWMGFNPGRDQQEKLIPMVEAMMESMTRMVYMRQIGVERYSIKALTPASATVDWIDRRPRDLSPMRLAVEWINEKGIEIRRVVSPPLDPLVMPASLNIGQAPDTNMRSEQYRLRISLRDRNDQITYDSTERHLKIFPQKENGHGGERVGVSAGQLVIGRRPVYMLGVNYWPRLAGELAQHDRHWLDYAHFDPGQLAFDLDLMMSVGINSIAIEYTDLHQAPQLLYVLDELRSRSMWAVLYIPALHPLDLRMEEAQRLLEAVQLEAWPEVYALEIARGLAIKAKPEMRRLDPAWSRWIDEHFNSLNEAEQKLGVTFWRERSRLTGPPDAQTLKGPHRNPAVALYFTFLHDYASRRMGFVRHWLREHGYLALLTARPVYGYPEHPADDVYDYLDGSAGALHLDFLFPDAWTIHPLNSMYADGEILHAYLRGIGDGRPIVWSAYGQHVGSIPDAASYQRQMEVYHYFLELFIRQASAGAYAWWFASGGSSVYMEDWGIVNAQGNWRLVEEAFRSAKLRLRQTRMQARAVVRQNAPLNLSAKQWRDQQTDRSGLFAKAVSADVTEWTLPGNGLRSDVLLNPNPEQRWTEVEGFHLLNAEWGAISSGDTALERPPGENVRIYTGKPIKMELMNSGSIQWVSSSERKPGSIWLRFSQPGQTDEWTGLMPLDRGGTQTINWTPRETGLWEIQAYMIGYGKFGEKLNVEATAPPRLF